VNLDHLDKRTVGFVDALVRLFMDRLNRARTGWEHRIFTDDLETACPFEDVEDIILEPTDRNLETRAAQLGHQLAKPF
jgi:hypothetical protein